MPEVKNEGCLAAGASIYEVWDGSAMEIVELGAINNTGKKIVITAMSSKTKVFSYEITAKSSMSIKLNKNIRPRLSSSLGDMKLDGISLFWTFGR